MLVAGGGGSQENDGCLMGVRDGTGGSEGPLVHEVAMPIVGCQEKKELLGRSRFNPGTTGVLGPVVCLITPAFKSGMLLPQEDEVRGRKCAGPPGSGVRVWEDGGFSSICTLSGMEFEDRPLQGKQTGSELPRTCASGVMSVFIAIGPRVGTVVVSTLI